MNEVDKMCEAAKSPYVLYLFLQHNYRPQDNMIYGFVEGKDDLTYYRHNLDPILDYHSRSITIKEIGTVVEKGGKAKVIELYHLIEWSKFDKKRVLFFVDCDLSPFFEHKDPIDANIYVTDDYSIENSIVSSYTLKRIITDILGLNHVKEEGIDNIVSKFINQKEKFCDIMIDVMANIIHWKKNGVERPQYNNLKLGNFVKIDECCVTPKIYCETFLKLLYGQSNVNFENYNESDVKKIKEELLLSKNYIKYVRGKYIMWFFEQFVRSLADNIDKFDILEAGVTYRKKSINGASFFVDSATRTLAPESLKEFISKQLS